MISTTGTRWDTIAAIATPPGRGGIAVVRLSGQQALALSKSIIASPVKLEPRQASLAKLTDPQTSRLVDQALVTYFKAPASYTGEDVIEFSCHGGSVTARLIVDLLVRGGAAHAQPGEFSLRAYLNGKIDLTEAEAVNDLTRAISKRGQNEAIKNLSGALHDTINLVRSGLLNLVTILEHELDFSEDEIDVSSTKQIAGVLDEALVVLRRLHATAPYGKMIRDGVRVVIIGSPNAGKSSLFNAMLGRERAIVTPTAGTTRDPLEGWIEIDGYPLCLVDTAGLRQTDDDIEIESIKRSRQALEEANIAVLLDPNNPTSSLYGTIVPNGIITLYIKSKADLEQAGNKPAKGIPTSVIEPDGLLKFRAELKRALSSFEPEMMTGIVASDRQEQNIVQAINQLEQTKRILETGETIDIIAAEVRLTLAVLSEIIGETSSEAILEKIFSEFCVGK
jgi:tRNA modification GTPase